MMPKNPKPIFTLDIIKKRDRIHQDYNEPSHANPEGPRESFIGD
mgnify:CR=1 FL=1